LVFSASLGKMWLINNFYITLWCENNCICFCAVWKWLSVSTDLWLLALTPIGTECNSSYLNGFGGIHDYLRVLQMAHETFVARSPWWERYGYVCARSMKPKMLYVSKATNAADTKPPPITTTYPNLVLLYRSSVASRDSFTHDLFIFDSMHSGSYVPLN